MNRLFQIIFADDLTGAMEVGLQAAPALVVNDIEKFSELSTDRTLVVNTQTRELSFDATQRALQKTLSFIPPSKICPRTKAWGYKIDSTLRGEIGAAIDVLRKETASELVLIAPAIPHTGRITKKGIHYLSFNGREIPIHRTVYGQALRSYPKTSSIPDLIRFQIDEKVELISLSTVRKGAEAIASEAARSTSKAARSTSKAARSTSKAARSTSKAARFTGTIVVADATTEDDLDAIARALMKTDKSVLPVGSAGLFAALCRISGKEAKRQLGKKGVKGERGKREKRKRVKGKILFLIGSLNPKTDQQVDFLLSSGKRVKLIELNSEELFADNVTRLNEIHHARRRIQDAMKQGFHPILRASRRTSNSQNPDSTVAWSLGKAVDDREILSKLRLVLVTGGETALIITKILEAFGMTVDGAVEPFVPIGRFAGGKVDNLPVVTKAGGFGTTELFEKLFFIRRL